MLCVLDRGLNIRVEQSTSWEGNSSAGKEIALSSYKPEFLYRVHKILPLDTTPTHKNPDDIPMSYLSKIHFNIIPY